MYDVLWVMLPVANFLWKIWHFKKASWVWLCRGGEEVCEEEVGVCEGTVDYVVDIILYILEEVCEEEVCVCEGTVYYVLNIILYILFMTNYIT